MRFVALAWIPLPLAAVVGSSLASLNGCSSSSGGGQTAGDGGGTHSQGNACGLAPVAYNETIVAAADAGAGCSCTAAEPCGITFDPDAGSWADGGWTAPMQDLTQTNLAYIESTALGDASPGLGGGDCTVSNGSTCVYGGNCNLTNNAGTTTLSTLSLTVVDGGATGVQSISLTGFDGGTSFDCTYQLTITKP